ncbi:MAG: HAMP domain-containing sensor histidine kinase [Pseudomonadota bacterium]|nr:HAMP domain-containing sensor histidine kinase [Pseudomonadota bacterium]
MDEKHRIEFSDIIAATIHDTKNAIGMIFTTLEEMTDRCRERGCDLHKDLFPLQYEVKRLNNSLIRLLALYKSEKTPMTVNLDLHSVRDCLEEVMDRNEPILASRGISVSLDCPGDLFWSFDKGLVVGILDNVLNNAYRYTKDRLIIGGERRDDYLILRVEDNGSGYPPFFLMDGGVEENMRTPVSFLTGNTGLGLYFSKLAARSHRRNNRNGFIKVANDSSIGGGIFSLYLP